MKMKIGNVYSFKTPENWSYTPDDRQEIVKLINGNTVQDYGHIESGDKMSCTCLFRQKDFQQIEEYWNSRLLVDIQDEAGNVYKNCRVVIKSWSYQPRFNTYIKTTIEFWRL